MTTQNINITISAFSYAAVTQLKLIYEAASWTAGADKEHSQTDTHKFNKHTHTHTRHETTRQVHASLRRHEQALQTTEHKWKEVIGNKDFSSLRCVFGCLYIMFLFDLLVLCSLVCVQQLVTLCSQTGLERQAPFLPGSPEAAQGYVNINLYINGLIRLPRPAYMWWKWQLFWDKPTDRQAVFCYFEKLCLTW